MANCHMCGSPVPDNQTICSMCYGDADYGSDGYYREWLRCLEKQQEEYERYLDLTEEKQ